MQLRLRDITRLDFGGDGGQDVRWSLLANAGGRLVAQIIAGSAGHASRDGRALGASVLWDLGSVAGLEIGGAPFLLGEPAQNGWATPDSVGTTTLRVELFCDNPDAVIAQALREGARQERHVVRDHEMPWGTHRQGGFVDPFGHLWFVGDRSPLRAYPGANRA